MVENQENIEQKDILLDVDETKENMKEKEIKGNINILSSDTQEHKLYVVEDENLISQNSGEDIGNNRCCRICESIKECTYSTLFLICLCYRCVDPP